MAIQPALLYPLPARTAIQASRYRKGRLRAPRCIVIHDMEAPELGTTAEAVGRYFASPAAGGSTQVGVDTDSICRYVADGDTCAGAPGVNADGLHVEHAGYARQSAAEWRDDASLRILEHGALACAEWCLKYGIPVRWLTDDEIRDGATKGFLTHADATRALRTVGGHTDPGASFPRDYYLSRVNAHIQRLIGGDVDMPDPKPPTRPTVPGPGWKFPLPAGYWFGVDDGTNKSVSGKWRRSFAGRDASTWVREFGTQLLRRGWDVGRGRKWLRAAGNDGQIGPEYVALIRAFQAAQGLSVDGRVGPKTWAAAFSSPVTNT